MTHPFRAAVEARDIDAALALLAERAATSCIPGPTA